MIYVNRNNLNIPLGERVIGHYGDNGIETRIFENGEEIADCEYVLYISFSNQAVNSILLDHDDFGHLIWNIRANQILCPGIAHIQIKAISEHGEVWHSPKAAVEILHSIDEKNPIGEHIPTLFEQLDTKINEISDIIQTYVNANPNDYISRTEAAELISTGVNTLLLPLSQRLDGE